MSWKDRCIRFTMEFKALLIGIIHVQLVFGIQCLYSANNNNWNMFGISYRQNETGFYNLVQYNFENITGESQQPVFLHGEKYCLDAASIFPFSLDLYYWEYMWQPKQLMDIQEPVTSIKLSSTGTYTETYTPNGIEIEEGAPVAELRSLNQLFGLSNLMPVTFPCCCAMEEERSFECMCRNIPECGTGTDQAAKDVTATMGSILGPAVSAITGFFGKRSIPQPRSQTRFNVHETARVTDAKCPPSTPANGTYIVPIEYTDKKKSYSIAICFKLNMKQLSMVDSTEIRGLFQANNEKCECEPWAQLQGHLVLFEQYALTAAHAVIGSFGTSAKIAKATRSMYVNQTLATAK